MQLYVDELKTSKESIEKELKTIQGRLATQIDTLILDKSVLKNLLVQKDNHILEL